MERSLCGKLDAKRLSICISLFICFCYFSASYFLVYCIHHDEHFQILEFANFKRGLTSKANLAWEYEACLRPSLQPALAYICLNIVFLTGTLIDFWFYEKWVFSAFNYLNFNIIQGGSATFGVSPWHFYISAIDLRKGLNVLNSSLLLLALMFLFIKPKHPITWIFYPFLVVHSLIAHKETRFIYPILIFLPFIVVSSVQYLSERFQFLRFALWPWIGSLLIVNLFAFIATTVSVADNSTEIFKFLRKLPDQPIKVYYQNSFFFYTLNDGAHDITPLFYKTQHIIKMEKVSENPEKVINRAPIHPDTLTYIVLDKTQQEKWGGDLKLVYDPQPEVVKFINYRNWMKQGASQWKLYQLEPNVSAQHPIIYSP